MANYKFSITGFLFDLNDDSIGSVMARYYDDDTVEKTNITLIVNGLDYIPIADLPAEEQATIANIKEHVRVYADNTYDNAIGVNGWLIKSGTLQATIVTGEAYSRLETLFYDSQYTTEEEVSIYGKQYLESVASFTPAQQADVQAFADYLGTLIP